MIALVLPPKEPGNYVLEWDLVIEFVSWFSGRGWRGPAVEVRVEPGADTDRKATDPTKTYDLLRWGALGEYLRASAGIVGWIRGHEAESVARISTGLPDGAIIVEIGAFLGSSTVLLAGGRKVRGSGKVHAIDPFDCSGDAFSVPVYKDILESAGIGSLRQQFDDNIRRAGLAEWVEAHQAGASQVAATWTTPIDMLFLDGDQSRAGARSAHESWAGFLKSGGIIAIHNTEPRVYAEDHDGNRRLVLEEILPPRYTDIRLIGSTTFARKVAR